MTPRAVPTKSPQFCQNRLPPPPPQAPLKRASLIPALPKPLATLRPQSPLDSRDASTKDVSPHTPRALVDSALGTPFFVFDFLSLDMEPTTPHGSRHRAAADLFSPSAPLQESPSSMSSLSSSELSPQASPQLNDEADLVSHGYLFNHPIPGDVDYDFPDPNGTSISAPRIATLNEFEFEDYDEVSYDDSHDHDELAEEQVGGGPYALRANIVPSPRANRTALKLQERRRESQAVDAAAPANAQASTSHSQSADAPAPRAPKNGSKKKRLADAQAVDAAAPANAQASTSHSQSADAPAPRAPKNGSKKKRLADAPSALQFELPPTLHHPPPLFAPPPAGFAPPSAPQQSVPQQPTLQKPTAVTSTRRSETPSAAHQPAVQIAAARSTTSTAMTSTRRSETPSAAHQPVVQIAAARSSTRQARSATPSGPHNHLAPPQPMRASSLQAPATSAGTPDDYVPIPPENFSGTLTEFVVQAGFAPAGLPPPPPTWVAARRRSAHPPPLDAPDLEAKREMMDDPLANDQEGGVGGEGGVDDEDGVDANDNEDSIAALTCGRPTQGQRDAFDRAFADIRERIAQCASEARVSYGGVLKAFYQEEHTGLRPGKNSWNLYQRFANYDDGNRLRERRRLNPSYSSATPVPALKADELSRAYKAFVEFAGGEEEAHKMLSLFFQLGGTADDTIQARRRRFNAAVKTVEKLTERLRLDDFFALTIIVGAHTNEDEKLGEVIAIPGIEDALYEALATNADEIIGFQKTAAATIIIKEQAKMRRDLKEEVASSAAASSRPAVPSSTARGSRSVSSQLAAPSTSGPSEHDPSPSALNASAAGPASTAATAGAASAGATCTAAALLPANTPVLRRDVVSKTTTIFPCEIRDDTPDLQDLRRVMSMASVEDLGVNVFKGKNGFSWTVLGPQLLEKGLRIISYPDNVRLPSEAPPTKASGSWTRAERRWLRVGLAARSTPGQGMRFQRVNHPKGERNFVVFSHDYTLAPPAGAPDSAVVKTFWNSSTAPVHCTAGDNTSWEAAYDLDDPKTLFRPAPSKAEIKSGKKKAEPATPNAKEGSSSQKRKVDEDEDDEPEPEEETSPPPAKRLRHHTAEPQVGGGVGGGGDPGSPRRVDVPLVKRPRKDFPRTPPRVGGTHPRVRFMGTSHPSSGSESDDQPIQPPVQPPVRPQPKRPVPLFDSDDDDRAAARTNPNPKSVSRKRVVPDDDSEDEYSENDDAEAVDPSPRVTRARSKAHNPGTSRLAPSKAAPSKPKPVVKVFDGVEVTPPSLKKSRTTPAAPAPTAEGSPPPTKKSRNAAAAPATEASQLGSGTAASSRLHRTAPQRQRNPPQVEPANVVVAAAAPTAAPTAVVGAAGAGPAAAAAAPLAALAALTPAQIAQVQTMLFTALFSGAPAPGA
ncbi:hypothetical protein B0H13DRAFT_1910044 [Mycena leptocephala]|nr:hypothetical protein B0H13DRAFT_1910044 [Mycena leptocephala]